MGPRPQAIRRKSVVTAGWSGDEVVVRSALGDSDSAVRGSALAALARLGAISITDLLAGLADAHPAVRRRALGLVPDRWAALGSPVSDPEADALATRIEALLADDDPAVLETACFVAGECSPASASIIERLCDVASGHVDALCRESAVAALGSLGDPAATSTVVAACRDVATVRRRAVLALAAFDGDEVEAMMRSLASDRDWQVRQAAEELLAIGDAGS